MAQEQQSNDRANQHLILSGCKDIRSAGELQLQLLEYVSSATRSTVDCSELTSIDTSTIQLLLAAKREAGQGFQLVNASSESVAWFGLAGVTQELLN